MYLIRHSTYQDLVAGMNEKYKIYEDAEKVLTALNSANAENLWYVDGAGVWNETPLADRGLGVFVFTDR
jgi:hypothetical protein